MTTWFQTVPDLLDGIAFRVREIGFAKVEVRAFEDKEHVGFEVGALQNSTQWIEVKSQPGTYGGDHFKVNRPFLVVDQWVVPRAAVETQPEWMRDRFIDPCFRGMLARRYQEGYFHPLILDRFDHEAVI